MIEVVTSRNALLYRDALEDMFRLRPEARDGFDGDDAIYLLLTKDDGTVIGAHRLLPTLGPHVLADVLPEHCAVRGVQRAADVLEAACSFVNEGIPGRAAREKARNRLTAGLFEFCLRAGYGKITTLMPTDLLFHRLLIGLSIKPLGLPQETDGVRQLAVLVTTDRAALDALRLALDVPEPQVTYIGAPAGDPLVLAPFDPKHYLLAAA
jgi:N-acyl-L-homoserine lactone synthetase